MSNYRIQFEELDWQCPTPGARFKVAKTGSTQVRLVEFTPELSHPEWCTVGHAGYVLEGVLELKFGDDVVQYQPGDGILIPEGEADKHIPRAVTDVVTLILVEKI